MLGTRDGGISIFGESCNMVPGLRNEKLTLHIPLDGHEFESSAVLPRFPCSTRRLPGHDHDLIQ